MPHTEPRYDRRVPYQRQPPHRHKPDHYQHLHPHQSNQYLNHQPYITPYSQPELHPHKQNHGYQPNHQPNQNHMQQKREQNQAQERFHAKDISSNEPRRNLLRNKIQNEEPIGPTIFINPKMIKKFIGKSIELASSSASQPANASTSQAKSSYYDTKNISTLPTTATTLSAPNFIDNIDLKTSPRESLQAAATMAIVRLVTECIRKDNKRDEKLNKILVARLIDQLTKHERENDLDRSPVTYQHDREKVINELDTTDGSYRGITSHGFYELGVGGQPIPVIGGCVSNRQYNSPNPRGGQYPHTKHQAGLMNHFKPRHVSSDRRDTRQLDSQSSKSRNYSR